MIFEVTVLGSSSATPTSNRHPSAQFVNIWERHFLIDCGEGTQMQMRRHKIRFQRINHIFVSHLHGDHYLGLMGLVTTMHLLGRKNPLHVYSDPYLKEIIDVQLKASDTVLNYPLIFHPLVYQNGYVLFEDERVTVSTIKLDHRIPTCGFLFKEKPRLKNLIKEKLQEYRVDVSHISNLRHGQDLVLADGSVIPNEVFTYEAAPPRSFAYCSDTRCTEEIMSEIANVDLLYHEATFLHEMLDRAIVTFHTTALEAAQIALKAGAKKLLIGHFSARYGSLQPLLDEARSVFPETMLAEEGVTYAV